MAIGFSLPGIPGQIRGTAEEAGAIPDLGQAMMQGFRSNIENIQGAPRLLAQQLVSNQLANTINRAKAKYAEPMAKTGYEQALADLQNRNLINQYYPRMRESELKSAGLSQAHQQMVNQFYPDLIKSQLSGAALTQDQQRMVNEQLRRDMAIKQAKQDIIQKALARGANIQQATQLAEEQTQNLPSISEIAQSPEMQNYMTALQQGATQQPQMQEAAGYTPIPEQENIFAPEYGQGYDTGSFYDQQMLEALRQNAIAQELSPYMQVQPVSPNMIQPRGFTPKPQELPELQPYAESLAQAAPSYLAQPEVAQQQAPRSYAEQLKQQGYNTDRMIPELAALDNEYISNPAVRDEIEKQYPGTGIKREKDFPRDRFITTTTLPSGATKTEIQSLGGGAGGESAFKAASPAGKLIEDLHHYESMGDKKGAEIMEKSIKKSLETGGLEIERLYDARDKNILQGNKERAAKMQELIDDYNNKHKAVVNIQPKPPTGSQIVNDDNGNYAGYLQPLSQKQIDARTRNATFNTLYDTVSEGVKPYQGTATQVYNQLMYDLDHQTTDQNSADRLYKLLLAKNVLTSTSASELKMIDAPKVKNVMSALKGALGSTGIPQVLDALVSYNIDRTIQNKAQDDTRIVLNMSTDAYKTALDKAEKEREFIPARTTLKDLRGKISTGANVIKAKRKTKPIVLKLTSKGLEEENG
jgi:hypothetical protein